MKWISRIGIGVITLCVLAVTLVYIMFPRKNREDIDKYALEFNLNSAMIASIINIESGYDDKAYSSAGAIGLMQIKLATAIDMANRLDIECSESDLYTPSTNIRLGCAYLRYLLNYFNGNIKNTLSAYNWGLGNVRDHMAKGFVDDNGAITDIPVKETQDYLKKYEINYRVYNSLFNY